MILKYPRMWLSDSVVLDRFSRAVIALASILPVLGLALGVWLANPNLDRERPPPPTSEGAPLSLPR